MASNKPKAGLVSVACVTSAVIADGSEFKTVPPGTVISLSADEANDGLSRGIFVPPGQYQTAVPARPARPADPEAVAAAIADCLRSWTPEQLGDEELVTSSGKPVVAVLEKQLGYDITAADRDAGFEVFMAGKA